jgi:integrase/recombinase XerD
VAAGEVMSRRFRGPLGKAMERHLALRRSLGFLMRNAEYALDDFNRYCAIHHRRARTISRPMVVGYLHTQSHLHPATQKDRLTNIRQFARYLFQFDPDVYLPERGLSPAVTNTRQPYIYSAAQIRRLIAQCHTLRPFGLLVPQTYSAIIGLLWVTGCRIGEVMRLNIEDVDLKIGVLQIRQTKFFKSRLVPLSRSSIRALSEYQRRRNNMAGDTVAGDPFFINRDGRRCDKSTFGKTIHCLVQKQGWRTTQGGPPRVHDIRHSFATHALASFYQAGKDPGALLPVLATFLGHSNIANTQTYLHPSAVLLREAGDRWAKHVRRRRVPS